MNTVTALLEAGRRYDAARKASAGLPRQERSAAFDTYSAQFKEDIAAIRLPADDMLALVRALAGVCERQAAACDPEYFDAWEEQGSWERAGHAFDEALEHLEDATSEPLLFRNYSSHTGHPSQVTA
jgi:hypothetical protein